jgi:hypothetical protein
MTSDFYIVTAVTEIAVFCGCDAIRFGTDMTVLKKEGASIFRVEDRGSTSSKTLAAIQ